MQAYEVEIRQEAGREPSLYGTMLQEGRAATGGRSELFAPGSIQWPSTGVAIATEHHGAAEVRAQVIRQPDGRLTVTARATDAIRKAYAEGKKFLSVEFVATEERTTKGGVREVLRAFVDKVALVARPEYDTATAEVRSRRETTDPFEETSNGFDPERAYRWL